MAKPLCVYERNDERERRPSIDNFQPGDFTHLYQKAIETLELTFQHGINCNSYAVTSQELNAAHKLNIEIDKDRLIESEKSYPSSIIIEQMFITNEVIKRTEANSNSKNRVINILITGVIAVVEEAFDHPIGAGLKAVFEEWKNTK